MLQFSFEYPFENHNVVEMLDRGVKEEKAEQSACAVCADRSE